MKASLIQASLVARPGHRRSGLAVALSKQSWPQRCCIARRSDFWGSLEQRHHAVAPRLLSTTFAASAEPAKPRGLPVGIGVGTVPRWLSREEVTTSEQAANSRATRWVAPIGSLLVQLPVGCVAYSWPAWNPLLLTSLGVVAPATCDWPVTDTMWTPVIMAAAIGLTAQSLCTWVQHVGPRCAMLLGTSLVGSGTVLSALAVHFHSLPLLYFGWGALNGAGIGVSLVALISTLLEWFPDRKGKATTLALAGVSIGGFASVPIVTALSRRFFQAPAFFGSSAANEFVKEGNALLTEGADGDLRMVVIASAGDVAQLPGRLVEGVFGVGTGDTGATASFLCLAMLHLASMALGALLIRVPPANWVPVNYLSTAGPSSSNSGHSGLRSCAQTMRTPQFRLLLSCLALSVAAGAMLTPAVAANGTSTNLGQMTIKGIVD